jgi:hypothetical protein
MPKQDVPSGETGERTCLVRLHFHISVEVCSFHHSTLSTVLDYLRPPIMKEIIQHIILIKVGFEDLTPVVMKSSVLWDITSCSQSETTDVSEEYYASIFRV